MSSIINLHILNFVGEGVIEMKSNEVNGSSRDGEANVTLLRKIADEFAATVSWSAQNGSALYKTHYTLNQGKRV